MTTLKNHIVIAGGSGLVGSRLNEMLINKGYSTLILGRKRIQANSLSHHTWSPDEQKMNIRTLLNCDAIVNLAGAGVMDKSWTKGYREIILNSRINTNKTMEKAMHSLDKKPIYISASAIGFYGYRTGNQPFNESASPASHGFLENVTSQWEVAAQQAGMNSRRHVGIRIGLVLSDKGGAFVEMLKGFKFGFGSYFSPGNQWYSWVHIDDLCRLIIQALESESMHGMYNGVAPNPSTSKEIARQMAIAMYGSSRILAIPELALKLALGDRRHVLQGSCYVSAQKVKDTGFQFQYPTIDKAIEQLV